MARISDTVAILWRRITGQGLQSRENREVFDLPPSARQRWILWIAFVLGLALATASTLVYLSGLGKLTTWRILFTDSVYLDPLGICDNDESIGCTTTKTSANADVQFFWKISDIVAIVWVTPTLCFVGAGAAFFNFWASLKINSKQRAIDGKLLRPLSLLLAFSLAIIKTISFITLQMATSLAIQQAPQVIGKEVHRGNLYFIDTVLFFFYWIYYWMIVYTLPYYPQNNVWGVVRYTPEEIDAYAHSPSWWKRHVTKHFASLYNYICSATYSLWPHHHKALSLSILWGSMTFIIGIYTTAGCASYGTSYFPYGVKDGILDGAGGTCDFSGQHFDCVRGAHSTLQSAIFALASISLVVWLVVALLMYVHVGTPILSRWCRMQQHKLTRAFFFCFVFVFIIQFVTASLMTFSKTKGVANGRGVFMQWVYTLLTFLFYGFIHRALSKEARWLQWLTPHPWWMPLISDERQSRYEERRGPRQTFGYYPSDAPYDSAQDDLIDQVRGGSQPQNTKPRWFSGGRRRRGRYGPASGTLPMGDMEPDRHSSGDDQSIRSTVASTYGGPAVEPHDFVNAPPVKPQPSVSGTLNRHRSSAGQSAISDVSYLTNYDQAKVDAAFTFDDGTYSSQPAPTSQYEVSPNSTFDPASHSGLRHSQMASVPEEEAESLLPPPQAVFERHPLQATQQNMPESSHASDGFVTEPFTVPESQLSPDEIAEQRKQRAAYLRDEADTGTYETSLGSFI